MAVAVEADLLASDTDGEPSVSELSTTVRDRWGDPDLEAYLTATDLPASPEASRRFVVYAASWSTYGQLLTFVDLERADHATCEVLDCVLPPLCVMCATLCQVGVRTWLGRCGGSVRPLSDPDRPGALRNLGS